MPVTVTTRVDDELAKIIDSIAEHEGMDRSTVIRRFLHKSVKEWSIENALEAYEQGKLTLWQAAEKCNLSLWEMIHETQKRGIHAPYSLDALKEDMKALR